MVRAYKTASISGDVPLSRSAGRNLAEIRQRLRNLFGLTASLPIACVTPEQAERDAEWEQEKAETLAAW